MKKSKYLYAPLATWATVVTPIVASAQTTTGVGGVDVISPSAAASETKASKLVSSVITIILWIATVLAIIYLLWSGISYITAGGDTEKADKARQGIINAIIGLIIIGVAYLLVGAVVNAVSVDNIEGSFNPSL